MKMHADGSIFMLNESEMRCVNTLGNINWLFRDC